MIIMCSKRDTMGLYLSKTFWVVGTQLDMTGTGQWRFADGNDDGGCAHHLHLSIAVGNCVNAQAEEFMLCSLGHSARIADTKKS